MTPANYQRMYEPCFYGWFVKSTFDRSDRTQTEVWEMDRPNESPDHPTQKPVSLLSYLIRTYTDKNDSVLDFTMGSGSTGVACIKNKRNFIGIEKSSEYFTKAKFRIDLAKKRNTK